MSSIDEIRNTRIKKLELLKQKGINPYPAESKREITLKEAFDFFDKLEKSKKEKWISGRLMSIRGQGGIIFITLNDGTGNFQGLLKKDILSDEKFNFFNEAVDIGDFIEVHGSFFTTKRGEKTIEVKDWIMLSKSLRPLPEKWHGLQDVEERFRKRYLDILMNPELKELFEKKMKFWDVTRNFLKENGFLEVETPVLEVTTGGADAKPFATHHNSLEVDVYLRISMGELWQKKLMVAGIPKTFEIGRQFRNEGMDAEHLQDYVQMEFYWAYANYEDGMKLVEEMYKYIAQETFGTLKFKIRGFDVDLGQTWVKYDYVETIKKFTGVNVLEADENEIRNKLDELRVKYDMEGFNITRAIDNLWKFCRRKIGGPGFLINVPVAISPLAKRNEKNLAVTERFQPIIAGSELGNGYSELNDPIDQEERFQEQQKLREGGDEEAQMHDYDFVEALEYGMPPTCGFGMSERVFSFLMDKPARECQLFPLMKPKKEE